MSKILIKYYLYSVVEENRTMEIKGITIRHFRAKKKNTILILDTCGVQDWEFGRNGVNNKVILQNL